MKHAWDMMLNLCAIEGHIGDVRTLACDGNFIDGHRANPVKAGQNKAEIRAKLVKMRAALDRAEAELDRE